LLVGAAIFQCGSLYRDAMALSAILDPYADATAHARPRMTDRQRIDRPLQFARPLCGRAATDRRANTRQHCPPAAPQRLRCSPDPLLCPRKDLGPQLLRIELDVLSREPHLDHCSSSSKTSNKTTSDPSPGRCGGETARHRVPASGPATISSTSRIRTSMCSLSSASMRPSGISPAP